MNFRELVRFTSVGFVTSGTTILSGVNLTISAGDVFGVSGANGAGKTTLLRLLATLYRPTSGDYRILGADRPTLPEQLEKIRRYVALIGHSPGLWGNLTLRENITMIERLRGNEPSDLDPLAEVGLEALAGWKASHASLGMQRRVELARLLTWTPRLLLLDEPYAGLDEASRPLVDRIVSRVVTRGGAAVLVTHDSGSVEVPLTGHLTVQAGTIRETAR